GGVDIGQYVPLDLGILWSVLLNDIGVADSRGQVIVQGKPVRAGTVAQSDPLHQRPDRLAHPQQVRAGGRRRIVDIDVQAHPQVVQRPAAADPPRADNADPANLVWLNGSHRTLLDKASVLASSVMVGSVLASQPVTNWRSSRRCQLNE